MESLGQEANERFAATLIDLQKLKEGIERSREWYRDQATVNMYEFYVSGTLLILLSTSIPFLSLQDYEWKDTVVSLVSVAIALLTGLVAFNKWESSWSEHRQTQMELDRLLAIWNLQLIEARNKESTDEAINHAVTATYSLVQSASEAKARGARTLFGKFRPPSV